MVLGGEAGVCEVAIDVAPFLESSIIEQLEFVCDDKGDDAVCETFLEHQQAPNSAIAVLERMNLLEAYMKVKDVLK